MARVDDPMPRKVTAADQAWDAVLAYVNAAPDGTRLPPERAFAQRLGVSRSTLRAAIARLELLGLVEVRHGSGIVVRRPDLAQQLSSLLATSEAGSGLDAQALDLRTVIEPQLAASAARRRPQLAYDEDDDAAFHRAVAAASGNGLAAALVAALVGLSGAPTLPEPLNAAQHAAIVAAVQVGDADAARDAMSLHLRTLRRAVRR